MPSLGDAFVDVRADTRKLGRDIDQGVTRAAKGATGQLGGVRNEMSNIGAVAKAAIAGAAVGAVVELVGSFSTLEQAIGGTEAVFGNASGPIDEFAERAAESIGLAESEFRTATTLIGGQLKWMTGDVDLAAEQSIILTEVGADLAATYGGTTKEAVEALGSAFRGEADPAERFNLNLKIGAVNAKAVELGLARSTTEVDDNARAQATLALIMEQSTDAQGQFARETDTVAGQLQILTARMEDFKARAGEELAPAVVDLADKATNLFDALDEEVNLGWSQRLSASLQTLLGESEESVQAYIEQKEAANDLADGLIPVADSAEQVALDMARGRDRSSEYAAALDKNTTAADLLEDAEGDLAAEVQTATERLKDQHDAVRANIDPLFALREATADQAEAQLAVNTAIAEYGEGSTEHLDAIADLSLANLDLSEATDEVRVNTNLTRDAFINQQVALGLTREEAILLAEQFGILESFKFTEKTLAIRPFLTGPGLARKALEDQIGGSLPGLAAGGPVVANSLSIVGERGPELFVPKVPGTIIPNQNITTGGSVTIAGPLVQITGDVDVGRARLAGAAAADAALRRLVQARTAN